MKDTKNGIVIKEDTVLSEGSEAEEVSAKSEETEKDGKVSEIEEMYAEDDGEKAEKEDSVSIFSLLYDLAETLAITTCLVIVLFSLVCRIAVVNGDSMNNTLYHGDFLLISELLYEPEYGDIVVFSRDDRKPNAYKTEEHLVKRVIAVGGDVVDIDTETQTVKVNGQLLNELSYANFSTKTPLSPDFSYPLTVPSGHVFVMGDNRGNSLDSRYDEVGCVDERLIFGRVLVRFFPLGSFEIYLKSPTQ